METKRPYEMIQEFVADRLMSEDGITEVRKLVEASIAYERARCAKIADEQDGGLDDCCGVHACNCPSKAIAMKIRGAV